MRVIKVLSGQTVFDIALQELGSVLGVIAIAKLNDISITQALAPGQDLKVPNYIIERSVVADFKKKRMRLATASILSTNTNNKKHYAVAPYIVPNYWV